MSRAPVSSVWRHLWECSGSPLEIIWLYTSCFPLDLVFDSNSNYSFSCWNLPEICELLHYLKSKVWKFIFVGTKKAGDVSPGTGSYSVLSLPFQTAGSIWTQLHNHPGVTFLIEIFHLSAQLQIQIFTECRKGSCSEFFLAKVKRLKNKRESETEREGWKLMQLSCSFQQPQESSAMEMTFPCNWHFLAGAVF